MIGIILIVIMFFCIGLGLGVVIAPCRQNTKVGTPSASTNKPMAEIADTLSCLCDKWGDYSESERQSLIVTVCQQLRQ